MSEQVSSTAECSAIIVGYHGDIDRGQATAAIRYFADDVEFEARGQKLLGHGQVLEFLRDREARTDRHTVHVVANVVAVEPSPDAIEISALILLYVQDAKGAYALERVLDTVHRFSSTPAGWKITSRTSTPLHAPAASG